MARKKNRQPDPDEVLASITPKQTRRVVAVGIVALLGLLLLLVAGLRPPTHPGWLLFLVALGLGWLVLAKKMWDATGRQIDLTRSALFEVDGRTLCTFDQIRAVDRGLGAFKPAGGFLIRLKAKGARAYAPGLWWRWGRTIAVGGATARSDCKEVADILSILLAEREAAQSAQD